MRGTLLRSYRVDEWVRWFAAVDLPVPNIRGFVFDSSLAMAEAAMEGMGVALLPARMFERDLRQGSVVRPSAVEVALGDHWLTRLKARSATPATSAFRAWLRAGPASPPTHPEGAAGRRGRLRDRAVRPASSGSPAA